MHDRSSLSLSLSLLCLLAFAPAVQAGGGGDQAPAAEAASTVHEAAAIDYSSQIVWYDDDPSQALFLPRSVLESADLDELPVPDHVLDRIRYATRFPEDRVRNELINECLYEPGLGDPVPAESQATIGEWVADRKLAFVGTVIETVPGWSAWEGRPVQMVYLQVDEVLRDEGSFLRVGQVVAYSQSDATIDLDGVEVCSKLPAGVTLAEVGKQVLFTGNRFEEHPFFLSGYYVFPVRGEMVLPQPWTFLRDEGPSSLDDIRAAVRPEEER